MALGLLVAVNALISQRLATFLDGGLIGDHAELMARLEAFPEPGRVKVLVLGNSHAMAALRVPALAAASGMPADAMFSLAIPSGSALEARLLFEAHVDRFPRLERVICGVDELLLGSNNDLRARYMTRSSLLERWRYAQGHEGLEPRTSLLASWFFPLADYGVPLKDALKRNPGGFLAGLAGAAPPPNGFRSRLAEIPYAWGYPPPWNHPTMRQPMGRIPAASLHAQLDRWFAPGVSFRRGAGELALLAEGCRQRGLPLTFVEMPFPERLLGAMHRLEPAGVDRYRAALAGATGGHTLLARSRPWPEALFVDANHLAPAGATQLARRVATRLGYRAAVGATM